MLEPGKHVGAPELLLEVLLLLVIPLLLDPPPHVHCEYVPFAKQLCTPVSVPVHVHACDEPGTQEPPPVLGSPLHA